MCGIVFAASTNVAVIVIAGFLLTAVSNIFSNGFHIYQAEIFPTAIRSTASGVCYSLSRATSTVMPFIAVPALAALGPVAVFSGSAVLIVLLCLDVGLLGPRSTGLRSNRSSRSRAARRRPPRPWRPRRRTCPPVAAVSSRRRSLPAVVPAHC